VKKNNGRRKIDGQRKKGRKPQPPRSPVRARMAPIPPARPERARQPAQRLHALATAALRHIDWPALAILVAPLTLMALLEVRQIDPSQHRAQPAPWRGDLTREAMPLLPDPTTRTALASPEPLPEPWHGDLAREAMPLLPDPTTRTALASPEPLPEPWHGDLAREAMPLLPDPTTRTALASPEPPAAPWRGNLTREAMPLLPDPTTRTPTAPPIVAAAPPPPMCVPDKAAATTTANPPADFGRALATAARIQTESFVIYNARYVSLAYPGGDTPGLYGVCTDVIIRAYRTLGIDLQELIHASRLGRGDPSIDHRRVEVVRRFLARHGTSLPISEFAEDYGPGDIVTYHRPEGRISQFHIAIVTDQIAPSGRPLIVHNRGWGPQVEDALFVDRITGHYRLSPAQVETFMRTRAPRISERRRRTADLSNTTHR
jgi:uncharacterized protein YijF (DUF1287 family)